MHYNKESQKHLTLDTPKIIIKANKIRMKIRLCEGEAHKVEGEIFDYIEVGKKALDTINNGLKHRVLAVESKIFYHKLDLDLTRYKLEIM